MAQAMTKVRIKTKVPSAKQAFVDIKRRGPSMVIKVTIKEGTKQATTVEIELQE